MDKLLKFHMELLNSAFGMAGERAKSDSDGIGCILDLQYEALLSRQGQSATDTIKIKTDFIYFLNELYYTSVQIITNLKEKKVFSLFIWRMEYIVQPIQIFIFG